MDENVLGCEYTIASRNQQNCKRFTASDPAPLIEKLDSLIKQSNQLELNNSFDYNNLEYYVVYRNRKLSTLFKIMTSTPAHQCRNLRLTFALYTLEGSRCSELHT